MSAVPQNIEQHTAEADQEVQFEPGQSDFDQAVAEPEQTAEPSGPTSEEILDSIVPNAEPRAWKIGPEGMERTYIQKPLAFIAKMQWFSLVGGVLDKALSGENAMSLNGLFSAPGRPGQLRAEDFRDADTFVQAIGKLLAVAPDFLVDSYVIWLNVPDYDREIVRQMMVLPADEGGLSDEQGLEIIETFLDQNYDQLASFFGERLGALQARVQKLSKVRESRRSKR